MNTDDSLLLHRFGLGGSPVDVERIGNDDTADYLFSSLQNGLELHQQDLLHSSEALTRFREFARTRRAARKEKQKPNAAMMGGKKHPAFQSYREEIRARLVQFAKTDNPMGERLAHFWADHFAVSARQPIIASIAGAYEREAIRPHITGNFANMLIAVAQHPAMLLYLNNAFSIGPNSKAGKKRDRGLNENLARELLELHTVSVSGNYTTNDIQELAKAITGWSVAGRRTKRAGPGSFIFRKATQEPGNRTVLSQTYRFDRSTSTGEEILRDLALHPATARHLALKLARAFVSDKPSKTLIEALATTYLSARGELMPVYQILLEHPEARKADPGKFKTPIEFVATSIRGLNATKRFAVWRRGLNVMGQRMWAPTSPAGWDTDASTWATSDGMKTRLDFTVAIAAHQTPDNDMLDVADVMLGERLSDETRTALRRAADQKQAFALLLMSPEFQHR